ncbi:MAG: hypothetical protein IJU39_00785 [Clostridia bacterium]|nr:hypothetical protein [Clostridia bacterium]
MKTTKRIISLLLCLLMMFSCATAAFAVDAAEGSQPSPTPVDNQIDMSSFTKTVIGSVKVKPGNAEKLLTMVNSLVDVDGKVNDALKGQILVGQTVIDVIAGIVNAISEKMAEDPSLASFAGIIKMLFINDFFINGLSVDEKFSGAVQKLKDAKAKGMQTIVEVQESDIKFTSADFGFKDGDAYGFIDAFVCSLLDIGTQMNLRSVFGDFTDSVENGEYKVGNYNLFIELYELFELNPMDSVKFTEAVTKAESAPGATAMTRLRAVANLTFEPVADLITKVEKDGLDAIVDILPRLLYALDSGMVNNLINSLLGNKSLFGLIQFNDFLKDLDLNSGLIWDWIDSSFVTGTKEEPAGFDFDKDGVKETTLPLTKEQFGQIVNKLTYAADASVKPSVSSTQKNRLALRTDSALVSEILCDAVVEFLEREDGNSFARKALAGIDNKFISNVAQLAVSVFTVPIGRIFLYHSQDTIVSVALFATKVISIF